MIRVLKWYEHPAESVSARLNGWYEASKIGADETDSFAELLGKRHGPGLYLLLSDNGTWWREIRVVQDVTYREAS